MVGSRSMLATLFLATALITRPLVAQMGSATAIHTVSVTIPPRVKAQISAFSTSTAAATDLVGGVAVSVTATQPWVLTIGAPTRHARVVKWSRRSQGGYAAISAEQATVAAGGPRTTYADATLFLRSDARTASSDGDGNPPVVLTIAAR